MKVTKEKSAFYKIFNEGAVSDGNVDLLFELNYLILISKVGLVLFFEDKDPKYCGYSFVYLFSFGLTVIMLVF